MPNWVFNKVTFFGDKEKIKEIKDFMKSEESEFDFNNIVPMPQQLMLDEGSKTDTAIHFAQIRRSNGTDWKKSIEFRRFTAEIPMWTKVEMTFDDWADLGEKYLLNEEQFGARSWYNWCIDHWGTKWNACEPIWSGDDFVSFNTAWSAPEPVYRALAAKFPDINFDVYFADEDLGSNCGTITYIDGKYNVEYVDDYLFACEVWGYDPEEFEEEEEEEMEVI